MPGARERAHRGLLLRPHLHALPAPGPARVLPGRHAALPELRHLRVPLTRGRACGGRAGAARAARRAARRTRARRAGGPAGVPGPGLRSRAAGRRGQPRGGPPSRIAESHDLRCSRAPLVWLAGQRALAAAPAAVWQRSKCPYCGPGRVLCGLDGHRQAPAERCQCALGGCCGCV